MNECVSMLLASSILVLSQTFVCSKILKKNIDLKQKSNIFKIVGLLILTTLLFALTHSFVRVIMLFMCVAFTNHLLLKMPISNCFIATLVFYMILGISELIVAIILFSILGSEAEIIFTDYIGNVAINAIICAITLKIILAPKLLKKIQEFANIELSDNKNFFIIISVAGVIISSTSIYAAYFSVSNIALLFIVMLLIIIYTLILYSFFFEKKQKELAENKNNVLIENIGEYEKIIEIQKIEAHENKNQLRIIKEMIEPNNKELLKYVETLILEKRKEDENLLNRVRDIPNGGIRALIYAKLVNLKPNINVNLIISKEIDSKVFNSIDPTTNVDVCKILGVFLDNAIESLQGINKKILGIELYRESEDFIIVISNTYGKEFDISRLGERNYSTKGEGHGHGLLLVNKIISNNKKIRNIKQLNGEMFKQKLYIKLEL